MSDDYADIARVRRQLQAVQDRLAELAHPQWEVRLFVRDAGESRWRMWKVVRQHSAPHPNAWVRTRGTLAGDYYARRIQSVVFAYDEHAIDLFLGPEEVLHSHAPLASNASFSARTEEPTFDEAELLQTSQLLQLTRDE